MNNFFHQVRQCVQPVLDQGRDAIVPVILDGENAWEYYPQSGREFLRRLYDVLQKGGEFEALTVSEAIARHKNFAQVSSVTPKFCNICSERSQPGVTPSAVTNRPATSARPASRAGQ